MSNGERPLTGGRSAAALLAAPLLLAACTITPGGIYRPRPAPPPQRAPERVVLVAPPIADFSGEWVLGGPGDAAPGQARGQEQQRPGQARGRDQQPPGQAQQPPGQARGRDQQPPGQAQQPPGQARGRDQQPPGQAQQPPGQARGRDQQPPGQARDADQGPPGQVRAEQDALAAGAAPRLRIVQDERSLTIMREGAVPLTLWFDGRPVYFSGARGGTRGEVTGAWEGRRFEVRWVFYGERVATETYELNGDGTRLTVRNRVAEGRPEPRGEVPRRLVYHRVGQGRR